MEKLAKPKKPASSRRELGIYYTPQTAAGILAEWAIRTAEDTVLEPSFGGCALLRAAISRLQSLGCKNAARLLFGFDLDQTAFAHLDCLLSGRPESEQFKKQDFLRSRPRGPLVSAVLANPPFVSYRRMTEKQRNSVKGWSNKYGWPFAQDAGLWAYFLLHSLNFLKPGGRIAFILPSSINQADYAAPIRSFIAGKFENVRLISVHEQLFVQAGAVERTAILLAEGYMAKGPADLHELEVSDLAELATAITNARPDLPIDARTTIRSYLKSKGSAVELGSFAKISIGEVVGDVKFFVRSRDEWDVIGIPRTDRKPIVQGATTLEGLVLRKDEIRSLPMLFHPASQRLTPTTQNLLQTYSPQKREKNSTFRKRPLWYKATYANDARGFIPNVSDSGPRFVVNSGQVSCTNSVYKVFAVEGCDWAPESLAIAFQTSIAQLSAELLSRTLGSGGLKLEPSDLARLLVPATVMTMKRQQAKEALAKMDLMFRRGDRTGVRELADRLLLLDPGLLSPDNYQVLLAELSKNRRRRKSHLGAQSI